MVRAAAAGMVGFRCAGMLAEAVCYGFLFGFCGWSFVLKFREWIFVALMWIETMWSRRKAGMKLNVWWSALGLFLFSVGGG